MPERGPAPAPNQLALLGQRRFAPFFWTQFLGAANDNLFKFAFTILVTYRVEVGWLPPRLAGLVIGALFILPFLLLSATAGQLADKFDKARVMRAVKTLEIAIMGVAALGWTMPSPPLLLACVFLMGAHSALFGPVKYAYLPQHLADRELIGGNGLVEMGTFVAILLGQVAGGLLVGWPGYGPEAVAVACGALAVAGRVAAARVPASPSSAPALAIGWNPLVETARGLRAAAEDPVVLRALLGISWMWYFGAVFLAQFPAYAKDVLHGDAQVASALLVVFSVGVGAGSLLCEGLARRRVGASLVPLGALGMTLFPVDLGLASSALPPSDELGLAAFLAGAAHLRVIADLALLALSVGVFGVPLYTRVQQRSPPARRARTIAANNVLNALFMVASAVLAGAALAAGWTLPQVFLATGLVNAAVAALLLGPAGGRALRGAADFP